MDKKMLVALITTAIGSGIILIVALSVPRSNGQGYGAYFEIMGVMLGEFLVMLIAGLILVTSQKTKPVGNGILLGMLLTMVIGFGICTMAG